MPKVIVFSTGDSEDDVTFVNPKHITHWQYVSDEMTTIHLVSGTSITVEYNVWEVASMVDPGPTITNTSRRVTSGSLHRTGSPVTIETTLDYSDGSTRTTVHETTFVGIEHNDWTGKDYYRCEGGTFDGSRREDGNFMFETDQFINKFV